MRSWQLWKAKLQDDAYGVGRDFCVAALLLMTKILFSIGGMSYSDEVSLGLSYFLFYDN